MGASCEEWELSIGVHKHSLLRAGRNDHNSSFPTGSENIYLTPGTKHHKNREALLVLSFVQKT
jgi:hypothetical protein